jgi:hypothetical protein
LLSFALQLLSFEDLLVFTNPGDFFGVLMDENDPAGLSHCAQFDTRRYAQDERRPV